MGSKRKIQERKNLKTSLITKYGELKCFSDEIWLWLRYLYDEYPELHDTELYDKMESIYKNHIRGQEFLNGNVPINVAAAIFYIALVISGCNRTQMNVSEKLNINDSSLRSYYKFLKENIRI